VGFLGFIVLASLLIQIPNIFAMKYLSSSQSSFYALKIAFMTLPTSFIATYAYSMYYGTGISKISYPSLQIIAFGFSMILSIFVHFIFFKNKDIQVLEIIGMIFILIGITLILFKDKFTF
jgi:hypothetical protein